MQLLDLIFLSCTICVFVLVWIQIKNYSFLTCLAFISLIGVIFFRPLIGEGFFLYPKIIFENIVLISGFILLLSKLGENETKVFYALPERVFFIFLILIVFSITKSANLLLSVNQFIYFLSLYVLYWSLKNLPDDLLIKNLLLKTIIFSGILLIIYAVHQYTIGFSQMREFLKNNPDYIENSAEFFKRVKQDLIYATFIYPPAFGDYLSMLFLTMLGISYSKDGASNLKIRQFIIKQIPLLICICIIPVLILTKSKGSWVSLFSGIILFLAMNSSETKFNFKPICMMLLFIVCFVLIRLYSKNTLPDLQNFYVSYQIRLEYWKAALKMIAQHPLLGFGPGTFSIIYPMFKTKLAEETIMAHNSFLQLWAESGFFAFISFLFFLALFFAQLLKRRLKLKPIEIGLFAAFFSFLIQNFFDFGLFDPQRAMVAFGLLGIYSLFNSTTNEYIILKNKRLKLAIIIIFGICLFGILVYSTNIYMAKIFDHKAASMLKKGDLSAASNYSVLALKHNPFAAEYFFHYAYITENDLMLRHKQGTTNKNILNKSIKLYLKALELNQYAAYYHFRVAKLISFSKQINYQKKTLFHLMKAVEMYPVNPFYHEQLAEFYGIIKDDAKAKQVSDTAITLKKYFKKGTRD